MPWRADGLSARENIDESEAAFVSSMLIRRLFLGRWSPLDMM
jgi:hypothetical protein